jgi:hypothetical protein
VERFESSVRHAIPKKGEFIVSGMAGLDRHVTGNWGEDSVPQDPPSWRMSNSASISRDPCDLGTNEAVFLYVDEDDIVIYSYMEWRKVQSEMSAGLQEEAEWDGTWSVLLPGAKVPEEFSVEAAEDIRHDNEDDRGVVYGHRPLTIKGHVSGLTFAANIDLLDV